jgi:hypothetical protein
LTPQKAAGESQPRRRTFTGLVASPQRSVCALAARQFRLSQTTRRIAMKRNSFSAGLAMPGLIVMGLLLAEPIAQVRADEISDPVGDFLTTYTGAQNPGLDVVAHAVTLVGDRAVFYGRMAGPIAPTQADNGLYLIGLDRGLGTPRFLGGTPLIGPNVLWDSVVRINPNGTGLFNNQVAGVITPLNPADISIQGNEFIASVPLSLLLLSATRPPCEWTYNLWPRNAVIIGQNQHVSDLAPDNGNSPFQTVPEVACTTDKASLWPPNHKMVGVHVTIHATDLCTDPADLLLEVIATSDEPDNGAGDGNMTGDTDGEDGFTAPVNVSEFFTFNPVTSRFEGTVFLRAERVGDGGRTYTIEATVMNSHNNWATTRCFVFVGNDKAP